jgi:hypothetical protein
MGTSACQAIIAGKNCYYQIKEGPCDYCMIGFHNDNGACISTILTRMHRALHLLQQDLLLELSLQYVLGWLWKLQAMHGAMRQLLLCFPHHLPFLL